MGDLYNGESCSLKHPVLWGIQSNLCLETVMIRMESFNFVGVGARPWVLKANKKQNQSKPKQTKTTLTKTQQNKKKNTQTKQPPPNKTKTTPQSLFIYLYTQLHSLGVFLELSSRIPCLWEALPHQTANLTFLSLISSSNQTLCCW